jgi:general secretion pathway protein A
MVRDRWQFTTPPFAGGAEPAAFHAAGPQEEALARLEWLVEERQRCALVVGAEGCGKSHLGAVLARRLGGAGCEVVVLSLHGLVDADWLELLLARLPLDPPARLEAIRPWQKLEDHLRENTLMERTTVLVFDDADGAPAAALDGIARLVVAAEPLFARTLVVVCATPAGAARLPSPLRQRAAVRIELTPWDEADVAGFIANALSRVGADPALFGPEAVATLARFTGGVPAMVCRVARLAVVAAAADGLDRVDAATVERIWRDLLPDHGVPAAPNAATAADEELPPNSRVRSIRRLGD